MVVSTQTKKAEDYKAFVKNNSKKKKKALLEDWQWKSCSWEKKKLLGLALWKDGSPEEWGEASSWRAWQAALRALSLWIFAPGRGFFQLNQCLSCRGAGLLAGAPAAVQLLRAQSETRHFMHFVGWLGFFVISCVLDPHALCKKVFPSILVEA